MQVGAEMSQAGIGRKSKLLAYIFGVRQKFRDGLYYTYSCIGNGVAAHQPPNERCIRNLFVHAPDKQINNVCDFAMPLIIHTDEVMFIHLSMSMTHCLG